MPESVTDTKTPRLDALVKWEQSRSDFPRTDTIELLAAIHFALDGLRGDRHGSGPYGALLNPNRGHTSHE